MVSPINSGLLFIFLAMPPAPETTLPYKVKDDPKGGSLWLYGSPKASQMILLSAGFPDDQQVFVPIAEKLAQHGCLAGVMCLPGYDPLLKSISEKDGYSFDDWAIAVQEASKALKGYSTNPKAPLVGIFHDWGVVAGLKWTNRVLSSSDAASPAPDKLVLFDILLEPHKDAPKAPELPGKSASILKQFYSELCKACYQMNFAIVFLLQRYTFKPLAFVYFAGSSILMRACALFPTPYHADAAHVNSLQLKPSRVSYMCYPYVNLWKAILTNDQKTIQTLTLPKDLTKTPVLFLWGTNKNVMFHGSKALAHLAHNEKCEAHPIQDAGHWFYVNKEKETLEIVMNFLGLK